MIKKVTAILLFGTLIIGCSDHESESRPESESAKVSVPEQRTVRGVLRHFPSDVKSAEAWHGHNFIVGDTPVIATENVSQETMKRFVGLEVIVSGVWHPGEQWKPTEEESGLQAPVYPDGEVVVRGDGIQAASIKPAE